MYGVKYMSTMIVYQSILNKEDPQEVLVCRLAGYDGDIYIQEAYCSNPICNCNEIYLSFYSLDGAVPKNLLFGIRLNIERLEVMERSVHQENLDHEKMVAEFIQNIDEFKELLLKHYKHIKVYYKNRISDNEKANSSEDKSIDQHDHMSKSSKVVSQKDSLKATKIGRNDVCPCGSGKKYKHCCQK